MYADENEIKAEYMSERDKFSNALYHPPSAPKHPKPRALKRGKVKILTKEDLQNEESS